MMVAAALADPTLLIAQSLIDEPKIIHITDRLTSLEISRQAIREFAASKRPVERFAGKKTPPVYEVGDTRSFKVYNHLERMRSGFVVLDDRDFTVRAVSDRFVIWVETAESGNGHVREQDVETLTLSLAARTPDLSIDPSSGIFITNERIFGMPADVDDDGRVNVLLVDILDGWAPGLNAGYIAGFVWPGDLTQRGNESDIVYVDTYPGLYRNGSHVGTTGLESTLAHEYLHLIHLNYDQNELTFVDEGLAEWASVLNGYAPRSITYLSDVDEHNVSLFRWRSGADVVNDYQRAGLFTTYLAQRLGPEATGSILRQQSGDAALRGAEGYEGALAPANLSLADVLTDFHVANLLNDTAVDEALGYALNSRSTVGADPTFRYDAETPGVTSLQDFPLNPGAVQYFEWTNVAHLELSVDVNGTSVAGSLIPVQRGRVSARLIVEKADGSSSMRPLALGADTAAVNESAERVRFVLVHHAPENHGVRLDMHASWDQAPMGVGREVDELPVRLTLEQNYPNPFNPQTNVRYVLTKAGPTQLTVFDGLGRVIEHVVDEHQQAGEHEVVFDATGWPSGTYLYTLQSGDQVESRKMTLLR